MQPRLDAQARQPNALWTLPEAMIRSMFSITDHSGKHDISQLRALQDWFPKYDLKSVPAERAMTADKAASIADLLIERHRVARIGNC